MSDPMTPDQWLRALRQEGVTDIVEMPGWRTNNRNHVKPFTDVRCTMIHHTAGEGDGLPRILFDGREDLPGPLCHDYLDRDGTLYLVGNGRANHAGSVAANAYAAVRDEKSDHPYPDKAEPLDGNSLSYGLECENSGAEGRAWPARQYDVAVRVQAARCRHHGWSANSVWAHKEATRRKPVDPRLPMDQFRADVAERLAHDPSWNPGEDDDMPISDADAEKIARKVLTLDGVIPNPVASDNKFITLTTAVRNSEIIGRRLEAKAAAQSTTIAELTRTVTLLAANSEALDPDALIARIEERIEAIDIRFEASS